MINKNTSTFVFSAGVYFEFHLYLYFEFHLYLYLYSHLYLYLYFELYLHLYSHLYRGGGDSFVRGAARVQRAAVEITFVGGGGAPAVGAQCRLVEPDKYIYIAVDLFML